LFIDGRIANGLENFYLGRLMLQPQMMFLVEEP
jgi:hypothetical protein